MSNHRYSHFFSMKAVIAMLFVLPLIVNAAVWSQANKPSSAADLASYTGSDRERLLIDGAKREAKVVWYTTLAAEQNKQIAGARSKISRCQSRDVSYRIVGARAKTPHRGQSEAPHR